MKAHWTQAAFAFSRSKILCGIAVKSAVLCVKLHVMTPGMTPFVVSKLAKFTAQRAATGKKQRGGDNVSLIIVVCFLPQMRD